MAGRAVAVRGLRALLVVGEGSRHQRMVALLVKRPNQLRGEILSEFGMVEEKFLTNKDHLILYWPAENRYEKVAATSESMRKRLLLSLTPGQVVDLLLASPVENKMVRYRDYESVDGVLFPKTMIVDLGRGKPESGKMSLHFKELELNPRFRAGAFNLDIPKDAQETH